MPFFLSIYFAKCNILSSQSRPKLFESTVREYFLHHIKQEKFEEGLETLSRLFHQWRLRPNPSKTEVCVFHLGTHDANRKLTVQFDNTLITHVDQPKYLGMTLESGLNAFL
jgi:hypothetical protein